MRIQSPRIIAVCLLAWCSLAHGDAPGAPLELFESMRANFEESLEATKSLQRSFDMRYKGELEKLEASAQDSANLALVLAIREEVTGFGEGRVRPESEHAELAKLQKVYAEHSASLKAEENKLARPVIEEYIARLGSLRDTLTQSGLIDLAVQIQDEAKRAEAKLAAIPLDNNLGGGTPRRAAPVRGITVVKALYGSEEQFGNGTAIDVTEKAKEFVVDGKMLIENLRDAFGDPHPFRAKFFRMEYLRDGKTETTGKPYEFRSRSGESEVKL